MEAEFVVHSVRPVLDVGVVRELVDESVPELGGGHLTGMSDQPPCTPSSHSLARPRTLSHVLASIRTTLHALACPRMLSHVLASLRMSSHRNCLPPFLSSIWRRP